MSSPMAAPAVLDREFLEIRAKLLEVAASFDRMTRSEGDVSADPRLARIREALQLLLTAKDDRAEQIQLLFSRDYDDDWQQQFDIPPRP